MADLKLELVLIPVSDVDRAKAFYAEQLGFTLDVDHAPNEEFRVVQLTPPGSACSITIGKGITTPSRARTAARTSWSTTSRRCVTSSSAAGVEVGAIRHMTPQGWADGPDPEHADYNSFADFADPDGNTWVLQEVRRGAD